MQDDSDKVAGARLRELRIAAGMSQEHLSFAASIDQSTLSKIERLGPGEVGWTRFCRIVAALGHEVEISYRPSETINTAKIRSGVVREPSHRR